MPHYLPQWSSRAESAATYELTGSELRLTIPPEQGLWCAPEHEPPLRVSGIQSGVFSGEVGSTVGQQPFREGAVVREHQPAQSAVWMVGLEQEPEQSGDEWDAPRVALDVTDFHDAMQMMVAVFDFPDKAAPDPRHVPELAVDYVLGRAPARGSSGER